MLAGIAATVALPAGAFAKALDPDHAALARVQSVLDGYVASGRVPGIVVAVGRGSAPATFLAAGRTAEDPAAPAAGPDSLWRIYSMTKPITAIAAMILMDDGKLSLDTPISSLLPKWRSMRVLDDPAHSLASHPARTAITVRHLLTHTGGLTYQIIGNGPLQEDYARKGLLGGRVGPQLSVTQPQSLAAFADRLAEEPLLAEPGTQWNYSVGLDLLGRVVEVAAGMAFDRFVENRLLAPLSMTSTFWTVPRTEASRLATLYFWDANGRKPIDPGASSMWLDPPLVPYGGSGLVSSARDYDRFLCMLADGGSIGSVRILKRRTARLAMSNLLPAGVFMTGDVTHVARPPRGFGAGGSVHLTAVPGGVGTGTYGWFGAAGTVGFVDPAHGVRLTAMINAMPLARFPLHDDLVAALYETGPVAT